MNLSTETIAIAKSTLASISIVTASEVTPMMATGVRGATWQECWMWVTMMPGSLFQLFGAFLCLAFMGGGHNKPAALYTHVLCACAFITFALFGGIDACAVDIVIWSVILAIINVAQIAFISYKSKVMNEVLDSRMQHIYNAKFSPFGISTYVFVELITCKGCQVLTLEKGQKYAAEGKTHIDKLSMLLTGKMTVSHNNTFLHSVTGNDFIDSPEWESLKSSTAKSTYNVTITADSECRYITWKRKPLLGLLTKRRRLAKLIGFMIGRDVVKKLFALNYRHFTARGFHYDIRLPCIMSLRDDVNQREQKRQEAASQPGTPAGKRQRKLGRKANEHYARLFARRMSQRIYQLRDQKGASKDS